MGKNYIYLFFSCLSLVCLTGCWDQVQIEQRGFVIGGAIDMSENKDNTSNNQALAITYQFAAPGGMGGATQGQTSEQPPFFNLTANGNNAFDITRDMATKTSRSPFFKHLQILVLSKEVAETPNALANSIDFYLRDQEMRRSIKVMITPEKAKDIFDFKPANETLPIMAIDSITENIVKSASILPPLQIGEIHEYLLMHRSFVIPLISMSEEKKPQVKNAAVFHEPTNKMVGILNEEEATGVNYIKGDIETASIPVKVEGQSIAYEAKNMKANIAVEAQNKDNIEFTISIETEGSIVESFLNADFTDPAKKSKIEEETGKEIKRIVNSSIEKLQKDLEVDAVGLGSYIERNHYKLWQSIKDDWDSGENYFSKSTITVETEVLVRSSGAINETE
ncbi:Ger(x)C family spore germination protein [Halobacillus seohaensis]|uniref:Ger(X)C family spore germination protein n=1 Tax=Halobacillus seohaensis TaxID=447421 RepID=A0ABW2ER46_9BACI